MTVHDRLTAALRKVDYETTGGDLASRSSTSPEEWASALMELPGIAIVELQDVRGIVFSHEDGTPYSPDELRYFAGEALAAADAAEKATEGGQ